MVVQRKFVRYLVLVTWIAFTCITIGTGYQWSARSKRFRERDEEAKALSEDLRSRPVTTEDSNRNARHTQAIKDSADSTASAETLASESRRQFYWQALGWVVLTFVGAALLARAR
jgi:Flp pilus assembly protein TadB